MGAETGIAWTDHTFNPWWGCTRVSPGCEHCYAESWDARWSSEVHPGRGAEHWGPEAPRRFFGETHWNEPRAWNRKALAAGRLHKVFCASMADVFEKREDLIPWRSKLWDLIESTPFLDWQLLTKRPENWREMLRGDWMERPRSNVWIGTSVEDQRRADERIPRLLEIPAAVRFLSVEPLLEPIDLTRWIPSFDPPLFEGMGTGSCDWGDCDEPSISFRCDVYGHGWLPVCREHRGIHWVIIGGESGPSARRCDLGWIRMVAQQAQLAGVDLFVKQLGTNAGQELGHGRGKNDDPASWPVELQVRQFPR